MNMKKVVSTIAITLLMLMGSVYTVNAQDESSVQRVIDEIQQVAKTGEEIEEELRELSVNQVEEIDNYLRNKSGVTAEEELILTKTDRMVGIGSRLDNTVIEIKESGKQELQDKEQVTDYVASMTKDEKKDIYNILAFKSRKERTEEEELLYNEIYWQLYGEVQEKIIIVGMSITTIGLIVLIGSIFKEEPSAIGIFLIMGGIVGTMIALLIHSIIAN